jgi:hypothetical protein
MMGRWHNFDGIPLMTARGGGEGAARVECECAARVESFC